MRLDSWMFSAAFAIGLLLVPAAARADNTQGITETTIKIGNMGPFSGPAAAFSPLNYGPEAYLRYINAQGGVNGRKFETVFDDDSCNEAKGIAAAKKLIYEDKVFMLMSTPCSGVAMAIKPMIDKEGIPWIGIAANPKLTRPTVPSMFHVTYTGIESGSNMARFAMSKAGVKKVALVEHSNDWAHGYCDPATDYIKQNGGEIVLGAAMENGSTDATAQVLQIKASGAQAVLGCLYQPELVVLLRDLKKYGVDVPVIGALGADFERTIQQVHDMSAVKGRFYQPYQFKAKLGEGPLKEFHDIFVKYLKKDELPKVGEPTNFYYFGVPAGIVTVEAFRRAGPEPTREKWIAAMETLHDFDTGVLADKVTITHSSHDGVTVMYAVGLDDKGGETIYKSWGEPLETAGQ
ncbi:MAG: ABC transporter substrate-binding protein [Alphaproteobacteria bacterium]|nr:ABC transporter substrate-binding protein [Alphaproteobacteria bacterium]